MPISDEQYLDTSIDHVEWTLRIADLHDDRPWQGERRADPGTS